MYIKPKNNAKDLFDIDEDLAFDALVYTKGSDIPLPWDTTIEVVGDKVILEGSISGSSSNNYKDAGYCRCEISVEKFSNLYQIEIHADPDMIKTLEDSGWEVIV